MQRTTHPATIFTAAMALSLIANSRRTSRGAWRFTLGRLRAHVDGDGLYLWHRGAARVWCELRAKSPTPSPARLLPALVAQVQQTTTPAPLWRPTHHARPSHIALSIHGA